MKKIQKGDITRWSKIFCEQNIFVFTIERFYRRSLNDEEEEEEEDEKEEQRWEIVKREIEKQIYHLVSNALLRNSNTK